MQREGLSYDQKLIAIKDVLQDIGTEDATFAGFSAILAVEPQPSEKYLNMCYNIIEQIIKLSTNIHTQQSHELHDKLVAREQKLHAQEVQEQKNEHVDDILAGL